MGIAHQRQATAMFEGRNAADRYRLRLHRARSVELTSDELVEIRAAQRTFEGAYIPSSTAWAPCLQCTAQAFYARHCFGDNRATNNSSAKWVKMVCTARSFERVAMLCLS